MPLYPDPNRKKEVWLPEGEGLPRKMCPSCLCMQTLSLTRLPGAQGSRPLLSSCSERAQEP